MLETLLGFDEVTLKITTSPNGQKNIVVFPQGLSPLVIQCPTANAGLAEHDIKTYCEAVVGIKTTSNKDEAIAASTATQAVEPVPADTKTTVVSNQSTETQPVTEAQDDNQMRFDDILSNAFRL